MAAVLAAGSEQKGVKRVHGKSKLSEWVVGLVAAAISVNVLATELPRVMPYLIVLAVIYIIIRVVVYHTNKW